MVIVYRFISFLSLFLVVSSVAFSSQKATDGFSPDEWKRSLVFKSWKVRDGLPQNSVYDITQTPEGFLWFTNEEGLIRFDGFRFAVFNTSAVSGNGRIDQLNRVLLTRDTTLWAVSTGAGLARYKNDSLLAITTRDGLSSDRVFMIGEFGNGSLLIRTSAGYDVLRDGKIAPLDSTISLPPASIVGMLSSKRGGVWLGTYNGMHYFDGTVIEPYSLKKGSVGGPVLPLYENTEGTLFAYSTQHGVVEYREGVATILVSLAQLGGKFVSRLVEDEATGALWLGTSTGLIVYHHQALIDVGRDNEIGTRNITSLFRDREGSMWVGIYAGGFMQIRQGSFLSYGIKQGLSNNLAFSIFESHDGKFWVGGMDGLDQMVGGHFQNRLTDRWIVSITESRDGTLWVASGQRGLFKSQKGTFVRVGEKEGFGNYIAQVVKAARDGSVWASINPTAIVHFQGAKIIRYNVRDSMNIGQVITIHEATDGSIWFGSTRALTRFFEGKFEIYKSIQGKPIDPVLTLIEDTTGAIWVGTQGGGLLRFQHGSFQQLTTSSGLFNNVVYSLLDDGYGRFWMGSPRGIFRIDQQEANEVLDGIRPQVVSTTYGLADGMAEEECNSGSPASFQTRDGRLWFATVGGVVVYNPQDERKNIIPPSVVLHDVQVEKKSIVRSGDIQLQPGANDIEIEFVALSYVHPAKNRFRYKLIGYDDQWVEAGTRRVAFYTNVPPGEYEFQVIACNNDGVWNEAGASISLTLQPHFYQTSWFIVVLVVLVAAFGGVAQHVYRVYTERGQMTARLKAELSLTQLEMLKAQLKPHFLFNTLNTIYVSIRNDPELAARMVEELGDLLRMSLELQHRQEIPFKAELDFLQCYLRIQQARFESRLTYHVDVDPETVDALVPTLILQPIVENAFTHGFASQTGVWNLSISSQRENGLLEIRVQDNGVGFADRNGGSHFEGIGLSNTRTRLQLLYENNYSLTLYPSPGGGVTASIKVPFKAHS